MKYILFSLTMLTGLGQKLSGQLSATRSDSFDIIHTSVALDLTAISSRNFSAQAELSFVPKVPGRKDLNLDLLKFQIDSLALLQAPTGNYGPLSYRYNDTLLRVDFKRNLPVGDTFKIAIHYSGYPQGDASGWGGFHAAQGYFYNLGVGFAADPHSFGRAWFPCFDNFVERCSFSLETLSRLPRRSFLSGDSLRFQMLNGDTILSRSELQQAIPSYLVSFALSNYEIIKDTVRGQNGVIDILLAAKPADTANLRSSFRNLKAVFRSFEDYFGPYQWPRIGYVLTTQGAMEHATSIHMPISLVDGSLNGEDIIAHELAHHWFGNLVTCTSADDMWFNEGMAEYCSHLYEETLYGQQAYADVTRENAFNVINIAHQRDRGYRSLYALPHDLVYGYHVYQKGAMMAHNLRFQMGDSLFFASWQKLFRRNAYSALNTAQIRDNIISYSGLARLDDFWRDWIYAPGLPQFSVHNWQWDAARSEAAVEIKHRLHQAPALYQNVQVDLTAFNAQGDRINIPVLHSGKTSQHQIALPWRPVAILASYSGRSLTATLKDEWLIDSLQVQRGIYTDVIVGVDRFQDSGRVIILDHRAPPEKQATNPFQFRLNAQHYWTVQKIGLKNTKVNLSFPFNGSSRGLDGNLMQNGNDSLQLWYRAKGSDIWSTVAHSKSTGSPASRIGTMVVNDFKSGDYVLVNSKENLAANQAELGPGFSLFPNPTKGYLRIKRAREREKPSEVKILTLDGRLISTHVWQEDKNRQMQIELNAQWRGQYVLICIDEACKKIKFQP